MEITHMSRYEMKFLDFEMLAVGDPCTKPVRRVFHGEMIGIPGLVNIQTTMENHHLSQVNELFLWAMFKFANC